MRKEDSGVVMSQPSPTPKSADTEAEPSAALGVEYPATAERSYAPGLERWAENQRPKTSDHQDARLYRYVGTDLYQWYSKRGGSAFQDAFGEPFLIARSKSRRAAPASPGGWQPIESAPRDGTEIIAVTAQGAAVKIRWDDTAAVSAEEDICGCWVAVEEDQHPRCWTDGICWASNEDEEPSDPPALWTSAPAATAGPRSRDVSQDDQIPTPKPVPILAREGQEGDQRSSGVPAEVAASTGVKSDNQEGH